MQYWKCIREKNADFEMLRFEAYKDFALWAVVSLFSHICTHTNIPRDKTETERERKKEKEKEEVHRIKVYNF